MELVIGPEPKYTRVDPPLFERPVPLQNEEPMYSTKQQSGDSSKLTCLLCRRIQFGRKVTNAKICMVSGQTSLL